MDDTWYNQPMPTNFNLPLNPSWKTVCDSAVAASCYLRECDCQKKKKKEHVTKKCFQEKMYPTALPSNDGHICARTQPAYSPLVAPRKQAEEKALTGMMRARIARESEIRLLKCTINTQLGPKFTFTPVSDKPSNCSCH